MTSRSLSERRAFLRRLMGTALASLGAGALGLLFWDRRGPQVKAHAPDNLELPDFSIPAQAGRIAVVHGADRARNLRSVINALGSMAAFVSPGDKVLLKVNAAFASPPMLGATTHPDMVATVVALCLQAGAGQVRVTDNPINDPASCFELSGIGPAARQQGADVMLPTLDRFAPYTLPEGQLIQRWPVFSAPLLWADKVIGIAPVKDHHRSGASLTIKNWYGLLGGRRNIFHQQVHRIIAELAQLVKPTLVILDGTQSMMTNGPTGGSLSDLKSTQTLIAGTDPVAVDALGVTLLNRTAADLPYLAMAEKAGAGVSDYRSLKLIDVR